MLQTQPTASSKTWHAKLNLAFEQRHGTTVMADNTHTGPLRVQRSFDAEDGSKHVYILHPPGGYVAGDVIDIAVSSKDSSHVVTTSPGAAKFYRCEPDAPNQTQNLVIKARDNSLLEWLPQETIFFKDANAKLRTDIELSAESNFVGWEICCLGRTAAGEDFGAGRLIQTLNVRRDQTLIHRERIELNPNDPIHNNAWGLDRQPVFGTLIASFNPEQKAESDSEVGSFAQQDRLMASVGEIRELTSTFTQAQSWSVTTKAGIILVRYLGQRSEDCKLGFTKARELLLAEFKNIKAATPRIWAT